MLAATPSSPGHIDTLAAIDLSWKVGDVVAGQFVLRGELGRGGMSCVWDAYDTVMRRCVALKTTIDRARGDETLTHEARALAAVKHRGLPTAYSLGRYMGWTYLAIERLYGVTIEQRLLQPERGRPAFTIEEALRVLIEIADVLAAVHVAGMAHHDVKPANVMLCQGDRVAILDFGIMIPEVLSGDARPAGTPRYLAPEMLLGTIVPGQARLLDTYAFGVMAFEMLAGTPPFHAGDTHELMRMHIADRAPDLLRFRSDVPIELADLIDACLAKSPGERPATMDEVVWELRAMPPVRPRPRPRTQTLR